MSIETNDALTLTLKDFAELFGEADENLIAKSMKDVNLSENDFRYQLLRGGCEIQLFYRQLSV